jgi:hypothetical protein
MDYYQELLKALGNVDDVEYLFRTSRADRPKYPGSYYALHSGSQTTGFREPSDQKGKGYSLQNKSEKTFFLNSDDADDFTRLFRDKKIATEMVPVSYDQKTKTGTVAIRALEDGSHMWTGPFKKGDVLKRAQFSTMPQVGLAPVEMDSHISPRGTEGAAHFGSPITEVRPGPSRLGTAKLAGIGALVSGAGAANAGEYRRAAADIAESLLPLGMTPSTLAPGTLPPKVRAAQDAEYRARQQQQQQARMKAQALLRSGVPMSEEYRQGGRVRMI